MRPKGMNSMTINSLLVHIVNQAMEEIIINSFIIYSVIIHLSGMSTH